MRTIKLCALLLTAVLSCATLGAVGTEEISGEYLEARSCDVFTGPCFANGDIGLNGREAVMAWKVDTGRFNGQDLTGLTAALVIKASDTLSMGGTFYRADPASILAVIVVDEKASPSQRDALVSFVKSSAPKLTREVKRVEVAQMDLQNDHLAGKGVFTAGELARIETRKLKNGDCVCTNETVIYPPLTNVDNSHAVYTNTMSYEGKGLASTWNLVGKRSGFMGTFSR